MVKRIKGCLIQFDDLLLTPKERAAIEVEMELEDLVLKHFRVEKVLDGIHPTRFRMCAIEDSDGNYKAEKAEDVERALTNRWSPHKTAGVYVRMGKHSKWYPLRA
jgi:hypothetical protein